MTLGSLLLVFAAVDLAVSALLAMAMARRQQMLPTGQQGPAPVLVFGGGLVAFIILTLLAFYLPEADLVIL